MLFFESDRLVWVCRLLLLLGAQCAEVRRAANAASVRRSYWKNIEQSRTAAREYAQAHRDERRAYQRNYQTKHRDRHREQMAKYRERNARRYFDLHLQRNYGITLADYERMLTAQGHCCAICRVHFSRSTIRNGVTRLHVDHDHETNTARGLLCGLCNRMLGQARDDARILRAGARYLEQRQQRQQLPNVIDLFSRDRA